jgi:hypothetical protein
MNVFNFPTCTQSNPGSTFCQGMITIGATQQREDLIYNEIASGNYPQWLQNIVSINITDGTNSIQYYVMPDVLCVGTYTDFVRIPLCGYTYRKIADLFGAILPTRKMANQIWNAADMKLNPQPIPPDANMESTQRFIDHNTLIEQQRSGQNFSLITGHKKDTVICKHLLQDSSRVAIYGWFYTNGTAIQGLNPTSHDKFYHDYSHSGRLIAQNCIVNGATQNIYNVLADPVLCNLISDEGNYDATTIYSN